jgi:hypothetical protein
MMSARLLVCFIAISVVTGCGGRSSQQVAPGMNFNPPTDQLVMLPPPTDEQQVDQPQSPTCAPATGVTIYRVITGKDYSFEQAITEMHTDANGTRIADLVFWLNNHELSASKSSMPTAWAVGMINEQIRAGYYVIPYVNESARPNAPHVFIIYGIDRNNLLISDSNRHFGMNRFAVDVNIFQSDWLVNVGTKESPEALLIFVGSKPRSGMMGIKTGSAMETPKMTHGDLFIK